MPWNCNTDLLFSFRLFIGTRVILHVVLWVSLYDQFCGNCSELKSRHHAALTMKKKYVFPKSPIFSCTEVIKNLQVYVILGDSVSKLEMLLWILTDQVSRSIWKGSPWVSEELKLCRNIAKVNITLENANYSEKTIWYSLTAPFRSPKYPEEKVIHILSSC